MTILNNQHNTIIIFDHRHPSLVRFGIKWMCRVLILIYTFLISFKYFKF